MVVASAKEIDPSPSALERLIEREGRTPYSGLDLDIQPSSHSGVEIALARLEGLLEPSLWAGSTTGIGFIRFFGELVSRARTDKSLLERFLNETFDERTCSFRPYSISVFLKEERGIHISHKTIGKTLGRLAEAGRRAVAAGEGGLDGPSGGEGPCERRGTPRAGGGGGAAAEGAGGGGVDPGGRDRHGRTRFAARRSSFEAHRSDFACSTGGPAQPAIAQAVGGSRQDGVSGRFGTRGLVRALRSTVRGLCRALVSESRRRVEVGEGPAA